MTPYYDRDGITIYHGDCREILPTLGQFDLLLTDPPYGIKRDGMRFTTSSHGGHKGYEFCGWDNSPPTKEHFDLMFAASVGHVVWGANFFPAFVLPAMGWLFWDKMQRIDQSDGELAYSNRAGAFRVFSLNRVAIQKDGAVHPTQKPVALFRWCMSLFPDAQTILDPFAGSCTTGVAAKLEGRKATLIELEERYCEIGAKRMEQDVFDFSDGNGASD